MAKFHQNSSGDRTNDRGKAPHKGGYHAVHQNTWWQKLLNGAPKPIKRPHPFDIHRKQSKYSLLNQIIS
jgi:hypothetical protein